MRMFFALLAVAAGAVVIGLTCTALGVRSLWIPAILGFVWGGIWTIALLPTIIGRW